MYLDIYFIKKLKPQTNTNKSEYNQNLTNLFEKTVNLRGFNQKFNFNKVFCGNKKTVKDYFINQSDINIMNKIIESNPHNILKVLKVYFQVPQLMHPNKHYYYNRLALMKSYGIYDYNNMKTNLITSLINYGDCRELALILNFYYCIKEWDEYLELLKVFDIMKITKLIKNQKRIIDVDIYFSCYFEKFKSVDECLPFPKNINKYLPYNDKKYSYYENHNFVIQIKYTNNKFKIKTHDIMYNKYDFIIKNKLFIGDYIVNNKKIKLDDDIIVLGTNDFNKNINVIGKLNTVMCNSIFFNKDNNSQNNKLLFLSKELVLPHNFYDIDNFVKAREHKFDYLRLKYFLKNKKVLHYNGSSALSYFLLDDLKDK